MHVVSASTAMITIPIAGEPVVVVPQAYSYLLSWHDPVHSLVGRPASDLTPHLGTVHDWQRPRWVTYSPVIHPEWGTGLLIVREGRLWRGPERWDSSD